MESDFNLQQIFLDFGSLRVLQSDSGREFTAEIILELASLWPDLLLVSSRLCHFQIQSPVEWGNGTKNSLICWMKDNKSNNWSMDLLEMKN